MDPMLMPFNAALKTEGLTDRAAVLIVMKLSTLSIILGNKKLNS